MKRILGFLSIWLLLSCSEKETHTPAQKDASLTAYVNPFIGTGGHGHTYPGATLPFGMMIAMKMVKHYRVCRGMHLDYFLLLQSRRKNFV